MAKVCQLFSGSSGNSIYIGGRNGGILVDIGVSAKRCAAALRNIGVDPEGIRAVLVTHEHSDHVAGVRVFASRHKVPVFATPATLEELRFSGIANNTVNSYAAADMFAKDLIESGTTRLVLAHLSRENNVPEIARLSAVSALGEIGAKEGEDYRLYVSKPENDGGLIVL